jgi:hypothetical protein
MLLRAPVIIAHNNDYGWWEDEEKLKLARAQGYNVWGEYYPYAAGSTTINAAFIRPEVWIDQLGNRYEDSLQDPDTGEFYSRERYEREVDEDPTKQIVLYKMSSDEIPKWVALPGVVLGSDAMPVPGGWDQLPWDTPYNELPNMHPRVAGAHGKSLRIARENDIPLKQVLATFSYNPAKYLGDTGLEAMQIRGRMQEGMAADITVLDPDTVTDNATYVQGTLPTTGIPVVIVNGVIVVKNERVVPDAFPGQPIRFSEKAQPRFEPLSVVYWHGKYLTSPTGFHGLDSGRA